MDWKKIGFGALVSTVLTIILFYILFPLIFLGPLIGGFLTSYLSKGYEDYDQMDEKDGAVLGSFNDLTGLISSKLGGITSSIITGLIIVNLSVDASLILGLVGGVIGVKIKR